MDRQTRSLHYCHTLAIKDRINLTQFCDISCTDPVKFTNFLPDTQDLNLLKKDIQIFLRRLVCNKVYLHKILTDESRF